MATRKAITRALAVRYRDGSRTLKAEILDTVCGLTGYHRDYARRALRTALRPRVVRPRAVRAPKYDAEVVAALQKCWAVLNAPAGKRLAPMLAELVPLLRRYRELDLEDATAVLLIGMSAATIDRKLAVARAKMLPRGRSHTKPGSMLKSRIAMRTWAEHDEDVPGYVEIDLVAHEGGNPRGRFCFTLTVTDIATGWTENRTVPDKRQVHVIAAVKDVVKHLPFPIKGIDSVGLDTPSRPSKRAATCGNAAPDRSVTLQVWERIVRHRLIAAGSQKARRCAVNGEYRDWGRPGRNGPLPPASPDRGCTPRTGSRVQGARSARVRRRRRP